MSHQFSLFIAGRTRTSLSAMQTLEMIRDRDLAGDATIEIVDVLLQPERAEADRIAVTPTLVRRAPSPGRRIVGDLLDIDAVRAALDLQSV